MHEWSSPGGSDINNPNPNIINAPVDGDSINMSLRNFCIVDVININDTKHIF